MNLLEKERKLFVKKMLLMQLTIIVKEMQFLELTDSNNAPFNPILPDGVKPKPPTKPAHISDRISPYKFGMT